MFSLLRLTVENKTSLSAPRVNPAGANHGKPIASFKAKAPKTATDGGTLTFVIVVGSVIITSGKYAAANDESKPRFKKEDTVFVTSIS